MSSVMFDGVTLDEPDVKRQPKPLLNKTRLVSGKVKLTPSTELETSWQITCICTNAQYTTLLAKVGTIGSLVIDGTTFTTCGIKSWKEKEINPNTVEVTMVFEQDTS